MSFTPTSHELQLTINFEEESFTGRARIHVAVTDPVNEFNVKISKDLEVERVSFWQANTIYRGNPSLVGQNLEFDFDKENSTIHATLSPEIEAEAIKEAGYIEVEYKGKLGETGAVDGLHRLEENSWGTTLNADNVITLFPIMEDIAVPLKLCVITPHRAGVETNIPAGEHYSVYNTDNFSNNFTTGDDNILVSSLELKVFAPFDLVLQ